MIKTVQTILNDVEKNRRKRLTLNSNQTIENLRLQMFSKQDSNEAFHHLNDENLAILERSINTYIEQNKFHVINSEKDAFITIRKDLLENSSVVSADMFRAASLKITDSIVAKLEHLFRLNSKNSLVLLPWRAALSFCESFKHSGFNHFYHLGAKRNEKTLQTEIYYEQKPKELTQFETIIIADPMLATGNTMIHAISDLKRSGVNEENILIVSIISAPEGVDHILSTFPNVKIVVGNHDEYLNSAGFIVPGLGDFGDKYFENFNLSKVDEWEKLEILNKDAKAALIKKLNE